MEMRRSLENVLLQVLRMKAEIPHLKEDNSHKAPSQAFIQKINKLCFDVGAGMKQLVSTVINSSEF